MLILDTLPLVNFFKGESEIVKRIFLDAEEGNEEVGISVVTISELFYILACEKGMDFAKVCIENIKPHLGLIPVNAEIAEKAGELKFKYAGKGKKGLPMADAIIAATALENDAMLVTGDGHFKKIKDLRIQWI